MKRSLAPTTETPNQKQAGIMHTLRRIARGACHPSEVRNYGGWRIYTNIHVTRYHMGTLKEIPWITKAQFESELQKQYDVYMEGYLSRLIGENRALWRNANILDVGCGDLSMRDRLQEYEPSIQYTGLDILPKNKPDVVQDAEQDLPFPDDTFDIVTGFAYFPKRMDDIQRVLKPNGHIVKSWGISPFEPKNEIPRRISRAFVIIKEIRASYIFKEMFLTDVTAIAENKKTVAE